MLKPHTFSWGHRNSFHAVSDSRGILLLNPLRTSCNSTSRTIGMQTWRNSSVTIIQANLGGESDERPRVGGSGEMATEDMVSESAGNELVVEFNADSEAVRRSDEQAREIIHEDLSYTELMERFEFLKRLPHKLVRDIGSTIAGPCLLSTSKELPIVNPSRLGGNSNQWPSTKAWLEQLSIPDVEAWFASQKLTPRLGDYFALCIEYVLRYSPHVELQHLLTTQQVLQRVPKPVRRNKALPCLLPEAGPSNPVDESIQLLESMDLEGGSTPQEKVGKRKRKLLNKLERVRLGKGITNTIGEFDFLFATPALADGDGSKELLHHWEVSVKFLLYAGPWEAFGLKSPPSADSGMRSFEGSIDNGATAREVDAFLGSYLGPHLGETLLDRKARLCNQLTLSANPCAAIMLQNLYRNKGKLGIDMAEDEGTTSIPQEEDLDNNNSEESEHLTVVPSALLKGYLFYEYKLWSFLESRTSTPSMNGMTQTEPGEEASLSRSHWMGWWTRDIMEFGDLPGHEHSKWYVVPKLEWLSPVVIPSSDRDRCARVQGLPDFVLLAAQMVEEADRLQLPRKRRLFVAELCWTPDWEPCGAGAWLEVSRGFLVEDSWPDNKMYKPHGYVVSWSPSLQGHHDPDV